MIGRVTILALAAALLLTAAVPPRAFAAPADTRVERAATEFSAPRRRVPRLTVTPYWRAYRECVDWYAVEPRAAGPTVVPHMRCWWARR